MPHLTRRHVLLSAAATAAVAAMPAFAIAAVEQAPEPMAGWAFVVDDVTKALLARLPIDLASDAGEEVLFELMVASAGVDMEAGQHRWIAANIDDGDALAVVGDETWSFRQACIDAGWKLEAMS